MLADTWTSQKMSEPSGANGMKRNEDGKNKDNIFCMFCPSKILRAALARPVHINFSLPCMHSKGQGKDVEKEEISEFWLVEDVYTFENIGVSQTVENIKYLACADCERGPVGWHDLSTKKSYIAPSRVKHQ